MIGEVSQVQADQDSTRPGRNALQSVSKDYESERESCVHGLNTAFRASHRELSVAAYRYFCRSWRFRLPEHLVQEAMQALAESGWKFEDALVPGDDEHLAGTVVNRRAPATTAEMPLNFLAHLGRNVPIRVFGEVGNYRFAANHGFDPFQRSQMETLGFANTGVSDSRSIRRARWSRVFTADSLMPSTCAVSATLRCCMSRRMKTSR